MILALQTLVSVGMMDQLLGILSLPWRTSDSNNTNSFVSSYGNLRISESVEVINICEKSLRLLSLLPSTFAVSERKRIFRMCISQDSRNAIKACAIKNLPTLLFKIGGTQQPNSVEEFLPLLV